MAKLPALIDPVEETVKKHNRIPKNSSIGPKHTGESTMKSEVEGRVLDPTTGPEELHGHSVGIYVRDKDVAAGLTSTRETVVHHKS